ncbi:MAG: hypothetical protein NT023_20420 [Armatimonadetes bacterium]|nr:hypothetical protein [Armatimonadota bacterium]
MLESDEVIGYFTLQADSIYGSAYKPKLGNTIPVVHLQFLARDYSHRGMEIGEILLVEVFRRTLLASQYIAITGVHLEYTTEGKRLYERYGFGEHPYGDGNMLLSIKSVRAAKQVKDEERL